jgi:hypothetical protein
VAEILLVLPGCVLAVIGAVHVSAGALIGWSLAAAGAGVLAAFAGPRLRQVGARGPDVPMGLVAAVAFVAAYLVLAGLLAAFGGALTAVVLALLAAAGVWAGRRRGFRFAPAAEPTPHEVLVAATLPPLPVPVAALATEDLCVAWRRSYFLLLLATDETARRLVVQRRQDFLDELERRDRRGFLRWLDSGAKAGSDPSPYLTTPS